VAVKSQSSSTGFSFTGLFSGTSKAAENNTTGSVTSSGEDGSISAAKIKSVALTLCPLKLKFAIMLADHGLTKEAIEYVLAIKKTIGI
jgi:hypothetical protein